MADDFPIADETTEPPVGEELNTDSAGAAEGVDDGSSPGEGETTLPPEVQAQLTEFENLKSVVGRQGRELENYREQQSILERNPDLAAGFNEARQRSQFPVSEPVGFETQQATMQPEAPNGAADPVQTLAQKLAENMHNFGDQAQTAQLLSELVTTAEGRAAERGRQEALQEVQPYLDKTAQAEAENAWRDAAQAVQTQLGKDILADPDEQTKLRRANAEIVAEMGLPPDTVMPPKLIVSHAYGSQIFEAGKAAAQAAEQQRLKTVKESSRTATPGSPPGRGAPAKPKGVASLSAYLDHEAARARGATA